MNEVALCLSAWMNLKYIILGTEKARRRGYIHNIPYHLCKFKSVRNNGRVVYGHVLMLCVKTDMEIINSKARLGIPGEGADG